MCRSCKDKNVVSKDLTKLASIENLDALQGNSSDEAKYVILIM